MRRYLAKALAILLVAFSASALAMGLGDIRLNSHLNQRLDAEIELVSAAADEVDTLVVELADRTAYERVGLERPSILGSLEFEVVRRPNGTAYIKVTSDEPIREPFLTFLVEADWSRGRLLREYTLLLDPPTFADREQAAEARSPAAAETPKQPEPQPQPRQQAEVEPVAQEEPVTSEPMPAREEAAGPEQAPAEEAPVEEAVAEPAREDVNIPPLEADRDERREPVYRQAPSQDMGDSYGPIQRNETLWSIASRMRPDDSVTMNQMMVAIYRANPEAFAGNMNRMKRGYILRIPEFNEVSSLTRTEAFRAAKQMNEEWDSSRTRVASEDFRTEPESDDSLSLVAPEEDVEPEVGTGVGAGGETDDIGTPEEAAVELGEDDVDSAAVDLVEDDTETADRLIDIEDESMQAVQAGADEEASEDTVEQAGAEEETSDAMAEQTADEAMPVEDEMTGEPEGEPIDELPPLPAEDDAMADTGMDEADTGPDEAATQDMEDEQPADVEPAGEESVAETQPDSDPVVTTPRQPEQGLVDKILAFVLSPIGLAAIGILLVLVLGVIALMHRRRKQAQAQAATEMADWLADEEDADRTEIADSGEAETGRDSDDLDDVFGSDEERAGSGTEAIGEDDTDSTQMIRPEDRPDVGGADAAGDESKDETFDGSETVTLDENDPLSEADFNMAYGLYDQAAEVVQKASDREPKRADLLAKLCEIHFAANNKDEFMTAARKLKDVAGADSEDWRNVAIMGQQISPNDDLFAGGSSGAGSGVDLDFSASEEESGGDETDFESTMTGHASEEPSVPESSSGSSDSDELDFDLDIGGLGDEGGDEKESTPAPADSAETETAAGSDDDLDFDLDFDSGDEKKDAPASEAPSSPVGESADDNDEFDLGDMDLGDFDSSDDSETDFGTAADAEVSKDAGEESSEDYDSDNTQTEFDKALSELSAYVDTNLPEGGAGDEVSTEEDSGGDDLNLDEFNFDKQSESAGDEDELGDDDEDEGLGEIGTKLDLARAYVDMGDPDGARSILEEVVEDGDEQQKQEARDLLDKL